MIEAEEELVENLSEASDVDGHDAGSGEVNIFIRTNEPNDAFEEVKHLLEERTFWAGARVAYREVAGSEYTILWPKDLAEFRVK